MNKQNALRAGCVLAGAATLLLGLGFVFDWPVVANTWPWPDKPLSHLFIGSILASIAVAFIWFGLSAEWGAMAAGAVTGLVMTAGQAVFLFILASQANRALVLPYAVWFAIVALFSLALLLWTRRFPIRDPRPLPWPIRISFAVFVVVLFLAATALILQTPIFPWKLNPDSSVMFGWIYMGDACYFLFTLLNPRWHNARAQLLSFLAYDVVLIPRFVTLFAAPGTNGLSLTIYLLVLFYSGLLAIYYLFIDRTTRPWAVQVAPAGPQPAPVRP